MYSGSGLRTGCVNTTVRVNFAVSKNMTSLACEVPSPQKARRVPRHLLAEEDMRDFYPTGEPFVDTCLAALKADPLGRLLPAACPSYEMAAPPPAPGTMGCLQQEVVEPLRDLKGRQAILAALKHVGNERMERIARTSDRSWDAQAVVIIEDNGWESQQLVNALATILLQEALGFRVVYLRDIGSRGSAERVGSMISHAVLEYWSLGKSRQYGVEVEEGRVKRLSPIGYLGQTGLYTLKSAWQADPSIWWDYYKTYVVEDGDRETVGRIGNLLPRNAIPNSVPPRFIHLSKESITTSQDSLLVSSYECIQPSCQFGQYYPPVCEVNTTTRLTQCPEIYFEYPQYNDGYFEQLITNANMHLTVVYLGDNTRRVGATKSSCFALI
eukprot:1174117-Prorocentrum_minimum.AAC.6